MWRYDCSPNDSPPPWPRMAFKMYGSISKSLYDPRVKIAQISTRNRFIQLTVVSLNLWQITYLERPHDLLWCRFSGTFWGASVIAVLKEELNPLGKARWGTAAWGNRDHSPSQRGLRSGTQANRERRTKHPGTSSQGERPGSGVLHFLPFPTTQLFSSPPPLA